MTQSPSGRLPSSEDAEAVAIKALAWIAGDQAMLTRFCGLTGIAPDAMRAAAGEPGFLGGVLEFLLGHEPTLLQFCDDTDQAPETVARAYARLVESNASEHGPTANWQ